MFCWCDRSFGLRRGHHFQPCGEYLVLNRANSKSPIFETHEDFGAFERVVVEAIERTEIPLLASV